jgi:outer membrane lipoprotein-sorting protein
MKKKFKLSLAISLFFAGTPAFALILPPGFVVKQFPETRRNIETFKIEQKITYKNEPEFTETLWVKSPNKFRAYIQKDDESILFIREGKDCLAITSGKRLVSGNLCRDISEQVYYRLLMPGHGYVNFLKSININVHEELDQLANTEQGYKKPEGIQLVRFGDSPIFMVGIDDSVYNSKLNDAKGSKNISDELIKKLREEKPQIWLDQNSLYPVRIFGTIKDEEGTDKIEINLRNYTTDANDVPMPGVIEILRNGRNNASFVLRSIETKLNIDDSFLDISAYKAKFKGTISEASLNPTKTALLAYLKKYR